MILINDSNVECALTEMQAEAIGFDEKTLRLLKDIYIIISREPENQIEQLRLRRTLDCVLSTGSPDRYSNDSDWNMDKMILRAINSLGALRVLPGDSGPITLTWTAELQELFKVNAQALLFAGEKFYYLSKGIQGREVELHVAVQEVDLKNQELVHAAIGAGLAFHNKEEAKIALQKQNTAERFE